MTKSIKLTASGSNNTQVAGNVTITVPQPMVTDSLIHCPDCASLVSRFALACPSCGFCVMEYFTEINNNLRQHKIERFFLAICSLLTVCLLAYSYFSFEAFPFRDAIPYIAPAVIAFIYALWYMKKWLLKHGWL